MALFGKSMVLAAILALGCKQGEPSTPVKAEPAIPIKFAELLRPEGQGLAPTDTLKAADGKRVQIEGYMALMEDPAPGGFWLCPTPVYQDESGAGTGDLPPQAVFVVVGGAKGKPVSHLRGLLSITGSLRLRDKPPRITVELDREAETSVNKGKPGQ